MVKGKADYTPVTMYYRMMGEEVFTTEGLTEEVMRLIREDVGLTDEDKQQLWELIVEYHYNTFGRYSETYLQSLAKDLNHLNYKGMCREYTKVHMLHNHEHLKNLFSSAKEIKTEHLSRNHYHSYSKHKDAIKSNYIKLKKQSKKAVGAKQYKDEWDRFKDLYQLYKTIHGKELYVVVSRKYDLEGIAPVNEDDVVSGMTESQKFFYKWASDYNYSHFYTLTDMIRYVERENLKTMYHVCYLGLMYYMNLYHK